MGSIRAGIVGFSGYSGQELTHLPAHHPDVEPVLVLETPPLPIGAGPPAGSLTN